jgi:hypothetical protein
MLRDGQEGEREYILTGGHQYSESLAGVCTIAMKAIADTTQVSLNTKTNLRAPLDQLELNDHIQGALVTDQFIVP